MTRRFGPEAHIRLNTAQAVLVGKRCYELHWFAGLSYRQVADATGLSLTTAWRRANLYLDWTLPTQWGNPLPHRLPPQRGTEQCPNRRPSIPGHDTPVEHRRPRHLVPGQRCTKNRCDGKPCQRWCQRGAYVCGAHGGRAPQVQTAARRRVAELEAESRDLEMFDPLYDRGFHHEALKTGAARRRLAAGPEFRRRERTEARRRRSAA